eukprot:CAMPEP_0194368944 /NCGR_PEP_ID=MMETSP0174-20130528/17180_1 /TAXON_ID=216777 /ORGANISM="Proboscia alata, Strain PI-D3" /LENGTH=324 /DNA_ID=CAMNT_0039145569 /DNA_START=18 /DNA_END=992 /DNA_ORIENTATION=-
MTTTNDNILNSTMIGLMPISPRPPDEANLPYFSTEISMDESFSSNDESLSTCDDNMSLSSEPIMKAVLENNPIALLELLKSNQYDPDQSDDDGRTPLFLAAEEGFEECCMLLLSANIDINACDEEGVSILHVAVLSGHVGICSLLLLHGADPDSQDLDGDSPRSCAITSENSSEMRILFRRHSQGDKVRSSFLFHEATLPSIIESDSSSFSDIGQYSSKEETCSMLDIEGTEPDISFFSSLQQLLSTKQQHIPQDQLAETPLKNPHTIEQDYNSTLVTLKTRKRVLEEQYRASTYDIISSDDNYNTNDDSEANIVFIRQATLMT